MVYRAVDAFKRRQVAIKQLHAHLLRQPEQAERYRKLLRNEVMLTARLRHPNIVRLLDADEHAATIPGARIRGRAAAVGVCQCRYLAALAQVLDIAYKCCNALEHASAKGWCTGTSSPPTCCCPSKESQAHRLWRCPGRAQ